MKVFRHNERVFLRALVIVFAQADFFKAVLFVERDGGDVSGPDLETDKGEGVFSAQPAEPFDQRVRDPLPPVIGAHGDVGDVALVQHGHHPHIAEDTALRVDGGEFASISGERDWEDFYLPIDGDGQHTVEWLYTKDSSSASGEDCGWIDDVTWTPAE